MATKTTTPVRLVKYTFLVAFEPHAGLPGADDAGLAAMGDAAAEMMRDNGALTVASAYDCANADVHEEDEEVDTLTDLLIQHFPEDVLAVGPVPGVKVLGRNGTFKNARLKREQGRVELWLGTEKEQYPLVSFPDNELEEHYPVPAGKRRRHGVEYGCGKDDCTDCYEPVRGKR